MPGILKNQALKKQTEKVKIHYDGLELMDFAFRLEDIAEVMREQVILIEKLSRKVDAQAKELRGRDKKINELKEQIELLKKLP